jgi:hypothetical protein
MRFTGPLSSSPPPVFAAGLKRMRLASSGSRAPTTIVATGVMRPVSGATPTS